MTDRTTAGSNGSDLEHRGSAMPPATTPRLEQDEHVRRPADTTSDAGKSSAELEREVERERAALTGTLDELRRSLSPGQLLDHAVDYAKHSGGREFADNLGRQVRDNPLPVLLIGAGIAWLMSSNGHSRGSGAGSMSNAASGARHAASSLGEKASNAAGRVSEAVSSVASSARDTVSRATSTGTGIASSAYESASRTGNAAAGQVQSASHRAGVLAHDARDGMHHVGQGARRGWSRLAEEQPLVLGAIGLAVGAAIAAMLPYTRTEDRLMGEASDAVKDQVRGEAQRQFEHAKDVAKETSHEIAGELDKRGLSPEKAADAAAAVAEKVGSATRKVAEDAKKEVQGSTAKAGEGSSGTGSAKPSGQGAAPQAGSTGAGTSGASSRNPSDRRGPGKL